MKTNLQTKEFENFIFAFGAAGVLLQKAHNQGAFLEELVLYASLIDGFCRMALILKEQIEYENDDINQLYICHDDKNYYSERKIYKLTFEKGIIDDALHKEMSILYGIRNKAIHRFFTSNIEYSHLEIVLRRYESVYQKILEAVDYLEAEQVKRGIGMTVLGKYSELDKEKITSSIYYRKIKSGSEKALAETLGCASVEEIIEFASKKGLFKKCKNCKHSMMEHLDMDKLKKGTKEVFDLGVYIGNCRAKECKCKKYEKQ